jgi:cytochrome c oxidase cbb3-type subunit III
MNHKTNILRKTILLMLTILFTGSMSAIYAAETTAAATSTSMHPDTMLRYILAGVITLFVLIIMVLSGAIRVAANAYQEKLRDARKKGTKILSLILLLSVASIPSFAQDVAAETKNSFSNWDVYLFITIILLLFVVVLVLVRSLFILMGIKRAEKEYKEGVTERVQTFFQRFNETVPIEEEDSLDLAHKYDGIRELDNKVPSWWTWTFAACILFSVVYLYQMFVTKSIPDQITELATANEIAAEEKLAYLKKGANNVDENTVVMLGADEIAEGATLFAKNCVACHGDKGQGNAVGPNLTDAYWIHKGGIKEIFYSIKYGWPEKGMKSWKEDFSPGQIAQISSYVKSLVGSNPPGAKEAQGDLYQDELAASTTVADSTTTAADSTATK